MQVQHIMLISQHAEKDLERSADNVTMWIGFEYEPSQDGKPWPSEISYMIHIIPSEEASSMTEDDFVKEDIPSIFSVSVRYAVQFASNDEQADEKSLGAEVMASWPYVRADLVDLFRLHGMSTMLIPANPSMHVALAQEQEEGQQEEDKPEVSE